MTPSSEPHAAFSLAARLRAGEKVVAGWANWPDVIFIEAMAASPLEAVVIDMQHGLHDPASVISGISALVAAGKPAVVRVPVGDFAMASRALDFGAAAVIAPMINSAAEARVFADFMKYPPVGQRSWGPGRAMAFSGVTDPAAYLANADRMTLALAMIETREGLAAIDEILAVPGIDGVFVGPSDLSIAITDGALVDGDSPLLDQPLARVIEATQRAGKIAGIFNAGGARAAEMLRRGFRFVTVGFEVTYVRAGIAAELAAMK